MSWDTGNPLGVAAGLGLPRRIAPRKPAVHQPPHAPSFDDTIDLPLQRPSSTIVSTIARAHEGRITLLPLSDHLDWQPGERLTVGQISVDLGHGAVPAVLVTKHRKRGPAPYVLDDRFRLMIQADERNYLGISRGQARILASVHIDNRNDCLLMPAEAINQVIEAAWPN